MDTVLLWVVGVSAGIAIGIVVVRSVWRIRSLLRVRRAGPPPPVRPDRVLLWRDPGNVEQLDFAAGPGGPDGAPVPPFRFVEEHESGSSPCVTVVDARNRRWRVKWGNEVHSETFAVRLAWACGFFAEPTYFIARGRIEGAPQLQKAAGCIAENCEFADARFELEERGVTQLFNEHGWAWNDNPFVGTRELSGLKILLMLLSNWDNKDVRDVARGSNTAIFEYRMPDGTREARYLIIDWGGTMGSWGVVVGLRGKWDCAGFEAQTPGFVQGVDGDVVRWGYAGQRTADAAGQITVDDVRWLLKTLGRVTDRQLRIGLEVSGATPEEVDCFTRALRARIDQLRAIAEPPQGEA